MNVTEANATQVVLEWVVSLTFWENASVVEDGELVEALTFLAERAHGRLGAGPSRESIDRQARVMLGELDPHQTVRVLDQSGEPRPVEDVALSHAGLL